MPRLKIQNGIPVECWRLKPICVYTWMLIEDRFNLFCYCWVLTSISSQPEDPVFMWQKGEWSLTEHYTIVTIKKSIKSTRWRTFIIKTYLSIHSFGSILCICQALKSNESKASRLVCVPIPYQENCNIHKSF